MMTSPTGVQIAKSLSGANPFIGIVAALLSSYQIVLCTPVTVVPTLPSAEEFLVGGRLSPFWPAGGY